MLVRRGGEHVMPRLSFDPKWISIVADAFTAVAFIVAFVVWSIGGPERHDLAVNGAWQAINSADSAAASAGRRTGSGGRIEALQTLNREKVSLKGLVVTGAYLEGIELPAGDLVTSHFDAARLARAVFDKATLNYAHFERAHMQFAHLNGTKARYSTFSRAFLNDADFSFDRTVACESASAWSSASGSALKVNFGPDDYDATWRAVPRGFGGQSFVQDGTNLYDAAFVEASLHRARFCGAYLYQAQFDGADAMGAKFNGTAARYASFRGAVLESADFRHADLAHADFTGACLVGANFDGANLGGAVFAGARLGLDPNLKTTFFGTQADPDIASIGRVLDALTFEPQAHRALVGYDVGPKADRLVQKWLQLDTGELPPSCPESPADTVPVPTDSFGEN
jgi:uncharacterized protein YjbI with pentapeptide repeats